MGAGPSLQEEGQMVKDITAKFAASFAKNYTKCYVLGLAREQKLVLAKQANEAQNGPKWKLLKCPGADKAPVRHTGVLLKRSDHLKKWNPRFFVVRGDWIIDFYENEEKYKEGKVRGTINMSGYEVHDDLNNTLINRLKALAEKVKLDISSLPKPEEFKPFTLELFHERRKSMYLEAPDEATFKKWVEMFRNARYYAPRYNITDDKIHPSAFENALWRARWECDMWGWWWVGGGEVAMISDAISDKISWDVMGKVDAKLTMPWAARSRIRDAFSKSANGVVTSAVNPCWTGAYKAVGETRDTIRAKLREMLQPIVEKQKELEAKILEAIMSAAKPTLDEKVTPNLAPVIDVVFSTVVESFKLIILAFEKALEAGKDKLVKEEDHKWLVSHYTWIHEHNTADWKMYEMYEPLYELRRVFDDIPGYEIIGKARRRMTKLLRNALYTFETRHAEHPEKGWDATAAEVRGLLVDDVRMAILRTLGMLLFRVVEPMWKKLVITPGRAVVKPMGDLIPDPLKEFLDPDEMLTNVANGILNGACAGVFEGYASKIQL